MLEIEIQANMLSVARGADYLHLDAGYGKLRSHFIEVGHVYFGLVETTWDKKPFHLTLERKELEAALRSLKPKQYDVLTLQTNGSSVVLRTDSINVSMTGEDVTGDYLKSTLKAMRGLRLPRKEAEVDLQELKKALKAVKDMEGTAFRRVRLSHKGGELTLSGERIEVGLRSAVERGTRASVYLDGDCLYDIVDWLRKVGASDDVSLAIKKDFPCKVSAAGGYPDAVGYVAPMIESE